MKEECWVCGAAVSAQTPCWWLFLFQVQGHLWSLGSKIVPMAPQGLQKKLTQAIFQIFGELFPATKESNHQGKHFFLTVPSFPAYTEFGHSVGFRQAYSQTVLVFIGSAIVVNQRRNFLNIKETI